METKIADLHKKACERGDDTYKDPITGYLVFTEIYHKRRGHCCESGCRHCPYGFLKKNKGPSSDSSSEN